MKICSSIAIILVIPLFFSGCILGKQLSKKIENKQMISYHLFYNNRTAKHKPVQIAVFIDSLYTKMRYQLVYRFDLTSDKVEKYSNNVGKKENYILLVDSIITENKNIIPGNEIKTTSENILDVTSLDITIFKKVIYFSDSLKLKDFKFLNQAKHFKAISKK
jgi:hypothetical protein